MDLNYIRNLTIQKRSKIKHLYAAISLLLIAAIMMSTATYAWLLLSTAPAATGVTTTVGANGSLEIALSTADHLSFLSATNMFEEDPFFEYATGEAYHDNVLWGNIVDLADSRYGLNNLILRPSVLNIIENILQVSNPLITVSYGQDGRITYEDNYSGVGAFDPGSQSYQGNKGRDYGVRVAGTPMDAELMQRIEGLASAANLEASTLLSSNTDFLLDVCYYEDTAQMTDTVELRSFIDSVLALNGTYQNAVEAIDAAFGSEAPDPEADALLKEIQANYTIAKEKLNAANTALKQLEPEVKEGEETPEPVALTMAAAHEIIAPLFGDLKLYTKEYAEDGRTFEWVPVTGAIPANQAVRIELGQDSYFQLLGALSGSYAMPGEYPSGGAGQGSNATGSAEWTAVIEDYSQVFKLESETMASKYETYLEEYETYSEQLNTYADKMQNLVDREYQDEVRFFYEYALHPLPDPETGLPDETTQPFTPAELEAYVSAIDGRVNELEEIVTFLEDYTKSAVMVYASSGVMDRETFQNVVAVNLANGTLRDYLTAVGLTSGSVFAVILETCDTARQTISDWREAVVDLENELNPRNENGEIISDLVRDMAVADLLDIWADVENVREMTVRGYGLDDFAQNSQRVFVQRISSVSPGRNGLYMSLARLQKNAWGTRSVELSDITYRENSDAQYLPGTEIRISTGSWYYYWELNLSSKEVERLPEEDRNACTLQYSRNRITEKFKEIQDTVLWENAYSAADKAIEMLNSLRITSTSAQVISDAVAERVTTGAETGYSSAYYNLMVSLVSDTETIMGNLEDALAKQVLLYAAGLAAREMQDNSKRAENMEPDSTTEPVELPTVQQDLYEEAKESWENENWTLEQLLAKISYSDDGAFDSALKIYRNNVSLLADSQTALERLSERELTWSEISSVLSNYWITDPASMVGYSGLDSSNTARLFTDVQIVLNYSFDGEYSEEWMREYPYSLGSFYHGLPADVDESYYVGLADVEKDLNTYGSVDGGYALYQIEKLIDRTEEGQGNTLSDREFVFRNETAQMESEQALIERYYAEYAETEVDLLTLLYRCGLEYHGIETENEQEPYTTGEIDDALAALEKLNKVVDAASECLVHTLRATAASSSTEESIYQTAIQLNDTEALLKALNFGEGHALYELNQDLTELSSDLQYANQGITLARNSFDKPDEVGAVLTQQAFGFLSPVQNMTVIGMSVPEFYDLIADPDAPYIEDGKEMTVAEMLINQVSQGGVNFVAASGALSKARGLFATETSGMKNYYVDQISVGKEGEYMLNLPVSISTGITLTGTLSNSVSWVYASGAPSEPSASGGNSDSNYIIGNTYAIAIDFLLRTNATGANLLLQTEGVQRIYSDGSVYDNDRYDAEEIEAMQGKGSFIQLYNDDPRDAKAWDVLQNPAAEEDLVMAAKRQLGSEIMEALRIAFVDTLTGEVYAYAKADWLDFDYEDRTITAELELVDEYGYEIPDAILKPLVQNQVSAISAWLYLDGTEVSNASVDSEKLGALTMNLQFATDAFLNPAYSENEGTTITPPQLDQPEATSPVAGDEFYVESNGENTYSVYTLNSAGARDYEMTFTGSMDADNQTVVINKVTAYPNGGVVIPALATYATDQEEYAIAIDPTQKPFADLGTDNAAVFFTAVDGEKISVTATTLTDLFDYNSGTVFTALDLSGLDTSKVTDMSGLFEGCSGLTELDISGIDTSNVTNMRFMFYDCSGLRELDLSGFDTSNVTNMERMFEGSGFTTLDPSGFDTSNVTNMVRMFAGCYRLAELDVSGFDTSNVVYMNGMFFECDELTELDVSGFNTSNVEYMRDMFYDCSGLTELDVSGFDTSNVLSANRMFFGCSGLTELDVSGFDTAMITDMGGMFGNCSGLTALDVSGVDTSNVTVMSQMFYVCSGLTELDVSGFDTANVTDMSAMFNICSGLTELDVSGFDTSKVTDMRYMFSGCSGLTELDVSIFDTANVTDMSNMFYGCSSLTELDISRWDMTNVADTTNMFYNCPAGAANQI